MAQNTVKDCKFPVFFTDGHGDSAKMPEFNPFKPGRQCAESPCFHTLPNDSARIQRDSAKIQFCLFRQPTHSICTRRTDGLAGAHLTLVSDRFRAIRQPSHGISRNRLPTAIAVCGWQPVALLGFYSQRIYSQSFHGKCIALRDDTHTSKSR